jgi:hypothetical protein
MAKSSLKADVRAAMQEARVERRRQAFSALLEGDAHLAAELAAPEDLEQLCSDATEYQRLIRLAEREGDIDELRAACDEAQQAYLAACAEEHRRLSASKAERGRLAAEQSRLSQRYSEAMRVERRLKEFRQAYDIRT